MLKLFLINFIDSFSKNGPSDTSNSYSRKDGFGHNWIWGFDYIIFTADVKYNFIFDRNTKSASQTNGIIRSYMKYIFIIRKP